MKNLSIVIILSGFLAACSAPTEEAESDVEYENRPSPAEILESSTADDWRSLDPENLLYIELERGTVIVALSPQLAQRNVAQIKALARENFYDGLSFYRVIDGFVAQGGDLFETRDVKSTGKTVAAEFDQDITDTIEFNPIADKDGYAAQAGFVQSLPAGRDGATVWHLHCTGAMAMARGNERDSGGTEFYIALQPQRYLDRNLSVFGRVIQGMEHLQALRRVEPAETEEGDIGETITTITVGSDIPASERTDLEILRSGTETFKRYVESRRNRPEEFFYHRPNFQDVCALSVPVRTTAADDGN